ncbi:MAG: hypothetical protein FJ265_13180 [Planctomycetes bacterium]|nr:hypothetical protein [Planctomycetota bacterium]
MRLLPPIILLACAGSLLAQTSLTLPAEYGPAWGRGSSSALGGNSTRTQMIFVQPFPLNTVVFGVGLRPTAATADRPSFTADLEVLMSSTAATPGALSTTFANNVGSDETIVLPRQIVTIPAMRANRSTGQFAMLQFPTPFVFGTNNNPNVCFELRVYGRSAGATWSTDRAFASVSGRAATAGIGCGTATISSTSTGGSYVSGATVSVTLANATTNALAILLPTFDQKEFSPGVLLPFSLQPFGAASGCDVLVNPQLGTLAYLTDATGAAANAFTVPAGFGRFGIGWQWVYYVPPTAGNTLGFATTASRATWIGPEVVVPNAQYVWDLSNVNAVTGNATTDSVPVVQFLIQ